MCFSKVILARIIHAMDPQQLAHLSVRERECLRLVSKNRGTGEIAALLKVSPETVETLIKRGRAKLGGISRFEAANALAEWEGRPHSLGTLKIGTAPPTQPVSLTISEPLIEAALDRQAADIGTVPPQPPPGVRHSEPGRPYNALQPLTRIALLIVGATLLVVAALGMMAIAKELQAWLSPRVSRPALSET